MKTSYVDLRLLLLREGYKCIDMAFDGDEIFCKEDFKFAISEVTK